VPDLNWQRQISFESPPVTNVGWWNTDKTQPNGDDPYPFQYVSQFTDPTTLVTATTQNYKPGGTLNAQVGAYTYAGTNDANGQEYVALRLQARIEFFLAAYRPGTGSESGPDDNGFITLKGTPTTDIPEVRVFKTYSDTIGESGAIILVECWSQDGTDPKPLSDAFKVQQTWYRKPLMMPEISS